MEIDVANYSGHKNSYVMNMIVAYYHIMPIMHYDSKISALMHMKRAKPIVLHIRRLLKSDALFKLISLY